MSDLELYR